VLPGMQDTMGKDELYETYGKMIPKNSSENISEIKIELTYLIYAVLYGNAPCELKRDQIFCYFRNLEMWDELRKYSRSKSTQRIIRRMYRESWGIV